MTTATNKEHREARLHCMHETIKRQKADDINLRLQNFKNFGPSYVGIYMELNDFRKNICLRKPEVYDKEKKNGF